MKTDLAVIGQGVVCPAGVGVSALLQGHPTETFSTPVGRPKTQCPVFRVDLKDPALQRWQKEPRLRRASPLSFFLVEAAEQALSGLDAEERSHTGLIVAFSTGCLTYSRRFFESIVAQGQKSASPMLFPETVFNSPVSHVAAILRLEGAAYALVGDETAWVAALKTAWLWLEQERVEQVLVLGVEEFEPACLDAYLAAGWLKRPATQATFVASEGAAGLLVRRPRPGDAKIIAQLEDGFIYRSKREAQAAASRCLLHFDANLPSFPDHQRHWMSDLTRTQVESRNGLAEEQSYLGEATTASPAWNTIRALASLGLRHDRLLVPVWGTTQQIGALQLEMRKI